ncbi:MAG: phospholipase D-like domain-containing protein [Pseudomonadota bacterium]
MASDGLVDAFGRDRAKQRSQTLLQPGRNCWRIARADRASIIVDAADYYRLAKRALLKARRQVILIGWDFDTRIYLDRNDPDDDVAGEAPNELGKLIQWLADRRPELRIYILKWDVGALKLLGRGTTLFCLACWTWYKGITFKLDGAHPKGASHHQKILVIDDAVAFCGGIDMTADRWDTREHQHHDPGRRRPTTRRRYGPWHDATMAVDGDVAKALGELARRRWFSAVGRQLPTPQTDEDIWPSRLEPQFRNVSLAVARTLGSYKHQQEVRENERLFIVLIGSARHFIYAENQYFASRVIAEAIARRLEARDGFEFVLVNPKTADGWLEEEVMGSARAELLRWLGPIFDDHFKIYTPVNNAGDDIYVHAKIMIVDDTVLRVGSSNMNNRSMGLDSECDLALDAGYPGNAAAGPVIERIRLDLMAEHLGTTANEVRLVLAETGSLIRTIEKLRGTGAALRPFSPPHLAQMEKVIIQSEALDPESSRKSFEPITRNRLTGAVRQTASCLG